MKKGSSLKPAPPPPLISSWLYVNYKTPVLNKTTPVCRVDAKQRKRHNSNVLVTRNELCRQDDTCTQSPAREHTCSGAVISEDKSVVRMISISILIF